METQNSENRNNRYVLFFRSRQYRRTNCCSICRSQGHNMRTCNFASRMREFELECSIKCQTMEISEFKVWLIETYTDIHLLRVYAVSKCGIQISDNIQVYIDAITSYIYETYIYQYTSNMGPVDEDYISLEEAMINVLYEMRYMPRETMQINLRDMEAALINDVLSGEYFETLLQNIRLINYGQLIQAAYQESSLILRYGIENLLQETENEEKTECSICFEEYKREDCVMFGCKHEFCKDCTKKSLITKSSCAYCRTPVTKMISRTQEIHKELEELVI